MPDQPSKFVELRALEYKKQIAISHQAIARSRSLIAGSKEIMQRLKDAQDRRRAIQECLRNAR